MKTYWIKFSDDTESHCQGIGPNDAVYIAEHLTELEVAGHDEFKYHHDKNPNVQGLPYPASPMVWEFDHPVHGKIPRFCYSSAECKGKSSCPRNPACTE